MLSTRQRGSHVDTRPRLRSAAVQLVLALAAAIAVVLPAACRQETILVSPPADTTGGGGGGGGGVRRAPLTVRAVVPAADSSVALALGWSDGLIPGAVVTARHVGFSDTATGTTDSAGTATLDHLLAGTYV